MTTLGIALVAVLASLTMGQNWPRGTGSFGVGPGFANLSPGFGSAASSGHGASLRGINVIDPFFNTTITCAGATTGFTGAATLRRTQSFFGPWWARRQTLGGSFVFRSSTATGTFLFVATERAKVEGGCSSDTMGPVIQRLHPRVNFFCPANTRPGVIAEVTLEQNREIRLDPASTNVPFDDLESYAGIGLAMCTGLTTDVFGRQRCVDPLFACCKLGFDNQDGILLPIP